MTKAEVWTTAQVAEHCGIDPKHVRKYMARWGIPAVGREPGRGGASLYPAKAVRAAKAAAPGKGNRTPRKVTAASSHNHADKLHEQSPDAGQKQNR